MTSSPLRGTVLWLKAASSGNEDHGKYKLRAKDCGRPCIVIADNTATDDTVEICTMSQQKHRTLRQMTTQEEQSWYIPIYPAPENVLSIPGQVVLEHGEQMKLLTWISLKKTYHVPLRCVEGVGHHDWSTYRLNSESLEKLLVAVQQRKTEIGIPTPPSISPKNSEPYGEKRHFEQSQTAILEDARLALVNVLEGDKRASSEPTLDEDSAPVSDLLSTELQRAEHGTFELDRMMGDLSENVTLVRRVTYDMGTDDEKSRVLPLNFSKRGETETSHSDLLQKL